LQLLDPNGLVFMNILNAGLEIDLVITIYVKLFAIFSWKTLWSEVRVCVDQPRNSPYLTVHNHA
jgi:hypothetical protein